MITKANFREIITSIDPETVQKEVYFTNFDWVLLEIHVFNVGSYCTICACDYDEDVELHTSETGNLFCDKDEFIRLLDEHNLNYLTI